MDNQHAYTVRQTHADYHRAGGKRFNREGPVDQGVLRLPAATHREMCHKDIKGQFIVCNIYFKI